MEVIILILNIVMNLAVYSIKGAIGFVIITFLSICISTAISYMFGLSDAVGAVFMVAAWIALIYPVMKLLRMDKEDGKKDKDERFDSSKWN